MAKWWILIKERFSPGSYIPMIVVFTAVNGLYVVSLTDNAWDWTRFSILLPMMFSFFFRMRLFDEIKDYEIDLKINPHRPLARGLLKISEVKKVLLLLILFELILAFILGWNVLLIHAAAVGYSLLMYEEFFIGDLLRPHLTTYAVTHTFVSFLLAISCGVAMTDLSLSELPSGIFVFLLMNWCFFNLFEFARKTFAVDEERESVPSYSKIFGRLGAWFLSVSQAILGVLLVSVSSPNIFIYTAFLIYFAISFFYLLRGNELSAKVFRNSSGLYLLCHYLILIYALGA